MCLANDAIGVKLAAMNRQILRAAFLPLLAVLLVAAGPEGYYRLTGVHDAASELELLPDHHFRYALAYGALDENAEGEWKLVGDTVLLTTLPTPKAPAITASSAGHIDGPVLQIKVNDPNGHGIAAVDFELRFASGAPYIGYTQDYGWTPPEGETRVPVSVRFSMPMYGLASPEFTIDTARANDLVFVLTPNDIGIVNFREQILKVTPDALVMQRGGDDLRYIRADAQTD